MTPYFERGGVSLYLGDAPLSDAAPTPGQAVMALGEEMEVEG